MGDRGGEATRERERRRLPRRHGLTRDAGTPGPEGTPNTHSRRSPPPTDATTGSGTAAGTATDTSASAANKRLKYSEPAPRNPSSASVTRAPGSDRTGLKPPSAEFTALSLLLDASSTPAGGNIDTNISNTNTATDSGTSNGDTRAQSNADTGLDAMALAGKLNGRPLGPPTEEDRVGSQRRIRKIEFIRLIEQALYSLGYNRAASELEAESQVMLETGPVSSLRAAVVQGQWDESSRILRSLDDVTPEALSQAEFLLQQQKFLEFLEAGDTASALVQLRARLTPLCKDRRRLHQLASWLMCTSREDLLARSGWAGKGTSSRLQLMLELQALLPPTLMIPDRRLERLVEQVLEQQEADCQYHNFPLDSLSLFSDHDCGRTQIPTVTTQVLEDHTDEVWYVQFSHDGMRLATASKDSRAIIWEIHDEFSSSVQHVLAGHTQPLSFVAWSPDDSMLVTCGSDHLVKLWSTTTGACLHTYTKHSEQVTACAWFPCGRRFISVGRVKGSGQDDKPAYVWDTEGNEVTDWLGPGQGELPKHLTEGRINDVAISHDGRFMVTIWSESKIVVHNLETGALASVTEPRSVTSLSMSLDSRFALVNTSNGFIHLWDLEAICRQTEPQEQPSFQYKGQVQGRFVIRSCLGGSHQSFIVSGSEDSQVYIWHRPTGEVLHVLPGHAGTVNAVSWPATRPLMFASASDDRTVRIWGLKSASHPKGASNGFLDGMNGGHRAPH